MFLRSSYLAIKLMYPPGRSLKTTGVVGMLVKHDRDANQFYVDVGEHRAKLDYKKEGNMMTILHTEVPPDLAGRGLGKYLAKEALEYALQNKFRLRIDCEFVQNFVLNYERQYLKLIED